MVLLHKPLIVQEHVDYQGQTRPNSSKQIQTAPYQLKTEATDFTTVFVGYLFITLMALVHLLI